MSKTYKEKLAELEEDLRGHYKLEPKSISPSGAAYHDYIMGEFDRVIDETKPKQYQIGIDTFERMRANATFEEAMGFIRWNIDKYNTRKKGQDVADYQKIKDYCDQAIWWLEKEGLK